jgi:predicted ATPase/DNA-binding winged helix-turn-helix (wHTH) protein
VKEFHSFRLDAVNQCLWRRTEAGEDERIGLRPKAFAVLRYLVDHAGRLVTQDELLNALWPDTFVQPEVLKSQILEIRQALGDRPKNPQFIETLPKRGYQFIAPVRDACSPTSTPLGLRIELPSRKLVGRSTQIDELGNCLQRSLGNQRQIVFITGEPGIGKTALADEFQRQVRVDEPDVRIARGQCVEGYGGQEAYYPILEALGQLCQSEGESVVQILATHAPTWLVQFPALVKSNQREILQREILGATRERMLREIGGALEIITSEKPLLLVFEDLQWADPSTVVLISALARRRQSAKLMLISTYRPVDIVLSDHPLEALKRNLLLHHLSWEIALEPLGEAQIAEYYASESGGAAVPEGLTGLIYRHTEGNPLFMVATLDQMHNRGLIAVENGTWQIRVPLERIGLEAPESLRKMIEVQIERLSKEEQRVLEVASVTGALFSVAVSATAADVDADSMEDLCEGLSRRHQIVHSTGSQEFPDGTTSARYEFVHALYREVLYHRIPPGRKAKIHLKVGERLEALYEQRPGEVASQMAQHFELGGDWQRAIKYLQLAADTAGGRFEPQQAAETLRHALELVKKLPDAEHAVETTILNRLAKIYIAWVLEATGTSNLELIEDRLLKTEKNSYVATSRG